MFVLYKYIKKLGLAGRSTMNISKASVRNKNVCVFNTHKLQKYGMQEGK